MSYLFLSQLEQDLQMEGFGRLPSLLEMVQRFTPKHYARFSAVVSDNNKNLLSKETPPITRLSNLLQLLPSTDTSVISGGFGIELYASVLADNQGPWVLCHVERSQAYKIVPLWPIDTESFGQAFPKPQSGISPESYLILSVQWPVWYSCFSKRGFALAHASAGALLSQIEQNAAEVGLRATTVIAVKTSILERLLSLTSETESVLYAVTFTTTTTPNI